MDIPQITASIGDWTHFRRQVERWVSRHQLLDEEIYAKLKTPDNATVAVKKAAIDKWRTKEQKDLSSLLMSSIKDERVSTWLMDRPDFVEVKRLLDAVERHFGSNLAEQNKAFLRAAAPDVVRSHATTLQAHVDYMTHLRCRAAVLNIQMFEGWWKELIVQPLRESLKESFAKDDALGDLTVDKYITTLSAMARSKDGQTAHFLLGHKNPTDRSPNLTWINHNATEAIHRAATMKIDQDKAWREAIHNATPKHNSVMCQLCDREGHSARDCRRHIEQRGNDQHDRSSRELGSFRRGRDELRRSTYPDKDNRDNKRRRFSKPPPPPPPRPL